MLVTELLDFVESAPAGARIAAVRALALGYLRAPTGSAGRGALESAITILLDGARSDEKRTLAAALADSADAARHILLTLAADEVRVAAPILARSPQLVDAELIGMLPRAAPALQIAIASRPMVSAVLSAAIVELAEAEVTLALLANAHAAIDPTTYGRIADTHSGDSAVREALLARTDLPASVHQTLVRTVADALGRLVVAKAWVSEGRANAVTREACDRATVAIATAADADALPALAQHLRGTGQLTTALMLRAVCSGKLDFFEAALAELASVPIERVVGAVGARRSNALRAVYAKAGLPAFAFDAFAAALEAWAEVAAESRHDERYRTPSDVAEAILARYTGPEQGEGRELAAMLRRFVADQAREAAHDYARASAAA